MTRGKYAAKAANRLVRLDNDLLREKCGEVADLKRRVSELESELKAERGERSSLIVKRASDLARKEIAVVQQKLAESVAQNAKDREKMADWLANYLLKVGKLNPGAKILPVDWTDVFTWLIGASRVGEYGSRFMADEAPRFSNRKHRRATQTDFNVMYENHLQDMAMNGEQPLLVRGGAAEKYDHYYPISRMPNVD